MQEKKEKIEIGKNLKEAILKLLNVSTGTIRDSYAIKEAFGIDFTRMKEIEFWRQKCPPHLFDFTSDNPGYDYRNNFKVCRKCGLVEQIKENE